MFLGYNTNGFAHHRLADTLEILAELGYQSVAITIDHHVLNPFEPDLPARVDAVRKQLERLNLRCVVETGARFLLDPRRKHQPTLLGPTSGERERRLSFLCQCVQIARELGAQAVSFWSGAPTDDVPPDALMQRLLEGCWRLCEFAETCNVRLAFEPEPGMFIDTMTRYKALFEQMRSPWFGLTLDIGHLHCMGETPFSEQILRWKSVLWNVHIEDMCKGVHEHLMFGEGEIDFGAVVNSLNQAGYQFDASVELSRHSHKAVESARQAMQFLRRYCT
ncbi:MAG: sugar phosphate isomerase/epimerase [Gemmataceae bacterium]|nr:sugar phosphate isomerase/epimerase [Gemmataceae bacterium]MCI0739564.1 sugar phosphate isomerase/epimerase [Gemmataceae bacterium]